jgi:rubrerythrin
MYPEFIQDAAAEDNKKALTSFRWAMEVEKVHEVLYRKAMECLGQEAANEDFYVCPFCGFTHEGKLEGKCPVCGTPAEKFMQVK